MNDNTYQIIGLISGIISLLAYGLYIYQIWWGKTRPSKSAWWILSVVWTVILLSSISLAPGDTLTEQWVSIENRWLPISYIVGSLAIAISSIWRGSGDKWEKYDYFCAGFAFTALLLYAAPLFLEYFFPSASLYLQSSFSIWSIISNPAWSLGLSIVADAFGLMPIIIHSYVKPEEEDLPAWVIESVASTLGLFAVSMWVFSFEGVSNWISPVYLTISNVLITILISRRFFIKKP